MTSEQADTLIAILGRMEFLLHASAITLGVILGVLLWIVIRDAMDRRTF